MEKYDLDKDKALLLVIDIQERLLPVINLGQKVVKNSHIMISSAKVLDLPIIVTEQYPKGLGTTIEELDLILKDCRKFSKVSFTSCTKEVMEHIESTKKKQIIIIGMETHVCVFQTVRDLLKQGYHVYVAADAINSRTEENYYNGLELLRDMGAVISNTESILFDLLKEAGSPEFKAISKLIK